MRRQKYLSLVCSGHSGSTLLALCLNMHPDIAVFGEFQTIPKRLSRGQERPIALCSFHKDRCPLISEKEIEKLGKIYGSPSFWRPIISSVCHPVYVSRYARLCSARYVVDTSKCPLWAMLMWRRYRWIFNKKFIILQRDPRGVIASYTRRGETSEGQIRRRAREWMQDQENIERLEKSVPAGRIHRIFYEHLAMNPERELRGICQFLSVGFDSNMLNFDQGNHHIIGGNRGTRQMLLAGSQDKDKQRTTGLAGVPEYSNLITLDQRWTRELSRTQKRLVEEICDPQIKRLNYQLKE